MTSDQLIQVCDFLMIDYITGTHLVNTFYYHTVNLPRYLINIVCFIARSNYRLELTHPFFNYQFKLNFWVFEYLKRHLISFQLQQQIQQMRLEDHALVKFGMHTSENGFW
jgi:hypothetical protein